MTDKKYFKRAFIRKIAYIVATGAVILLLQLVTIITANASTLPYTSARFGVNQCTLGCSVNSSSCYFDSCQWDSNHTMGNYVNFGSQNGHLRKIEFIVKDSGDYQPGQYIFEWSFSVNPRFTDINKYIISLYTSRNNGSDRFYASSCYISPISNYMYNVSCSFSTDLTFDTLKMVFEWPCGGDNQLVCTRASDNIPNNSSWIYWDRIDNFSISNDSTNAINNQTTIIQNNFNETNQNINNINDSINDDSIDDPDSFFEEMEDFMPSNGVITQLVALPITLYTKILNSINGTCSSFSLGSLYNTNLTIPCVDIDDYLGSTLWGVIDAILSGFLVLAISRKFIKAFNNFTSLKEGDVIND